MILNVLAALLMAGAGIALGFGLCLWIDRLTWVLDDE